MFLCLFSLVLLFAVSGIEAKNIAYIYGDVSADGDIPSGSKDPFHQMLLTDTGIRGCSIFRAMVEGKGHTITQYYDAQTELTPEFLSQFDVIILSLHQKKWSAAEKSALDAWIRAGGSIFIYSDSAAGGLWSSVGAQNTVGQTAVNNIIAQYGMQVTVDQANGIKAYRAGPDASHPIVTGRPVWEGEGVSPVAIDQSKGAQALIPYTNHSDYKVGGNPDIPYKQNITIQNPLWAALALQSVGSGYVIVSFDRQPMWNDGEGSDIEKTDNKEILSRIIDLTTGAMDDGKTNATLISISGTANDKIIVAVPERSAIDLAKASIFDMSGRLVYVGTTQDTRNIITKALGFNERGVYMMRINSKFGIKNRKIVIR